MTIDFVGFFEHGIYGIPVKPPIMTVWWGHMMITIGFVVCGVSYFERHPYGSVCVVLRQHQEMPVLGFALPNPDVCKTSRCVALSTLPHILWVE